MPTRLPRGRSVANLGVKRTVRHVEVSIRGIECCGAGPGYNTPAVLTPGTLAVSDSLPIAFLLKGLRVSLIHVLERAGYPESVQHSAFQLFIFVIQRLQSFRFPCVPTRRTDSVNGSTYLHSLRISAPGAPGPSVNSASRLQHAACE